MNWADISGIFQDAFDTSTQRADWTESGGVWDAYWRWYADTNQDARLSAEHTRDARIAHEWEGQCLQLRDLGRVAAGYTNDPGCVEGEEGVLWVDDQALGGGVSQERFTERSLTSSKVILVGKLRSLRTETLMTITANDAITAQWRWFTDSINTTRLPRGHEVRMSANQIVSPPNPRDNNVTRHYQGHDAPFWIGELRKVAPNSLVFRQTIGNAGGSIALTEERITQFNYIDPRAVIEAEIWEEMAGSHDDILSAMARDFWNTRMENLYHAAQAAIRRVAYDGKTGEDALRAFVIAQINERLSQEEFGAPITEAYGALRVAEDHWKDFFSVDRNSNYAEQKETELLKEMQDNYITLWYLHLIASLASIAEASTEFGPGTPGGGAEAFTLNITPQTSTVLLPGLAPTLGTSRGTADALFGHQDATVIYPDFESFIDDFADIIYRTRIHEAILAYEQELVDRVDGVTTIEDVYKPGGREYSAAVDRYQRQQRLREILRREQGADVTAEDDARLKRLAEQCFLVDWLPELAQKNQQMARAYRTFTPIHGRTDTIVNKLLYNPQLRCMSGLTPAEISSLVPKIRFFKVFHEPAADDSELIEVSEIEIPFETYVHNGPGTEIELMTKGKQERGRGAGIVSFDWTLDGQNPFAARRFINGKLHLFFQSMKVFLMPLSPKFRYVDLVNTGMVERIGPELGWNPDYFKLRAEVGWMANDMNVFTGTEEEIRCKKEAIEQATMSMFLTATEHNIDINDQGNINLTIDYTAWQEASYSTGDMDILATSETHYLRQQRRQDLEAQAAQDPCDTTAIQTIENEFKDLIKDENYTAWQRLLMHLGGQHCSGRELPSRVYFLSIETRILQQYYDAQLASGVSVRGLEEALFETPATVQSEVGPEAATLQAIMNSIPSISRDEDQSLLQNLTELTWLIQGKYTLIQFFYFGDLVEAALDLVSDSRTRKNLKLLLGPISFRQSAARVEASGGPEIIYDINLADIPISIHFFIDWFLNDVIGQNRRIYPAQQFIQNVVTTLIQPVITRQCKDLKNIPRQELQIRSNFLSAAGVPPQNPGEGEVLDTSAVVYTDPLDEFKNILRNTRVDVDKAYTTARTDNPIGGKILSPVRSGGGSFHYMLLYAINTPGSEVLTGDPVADINKGIYHFGIGKNAGLLKSVAFSKSDFNLREARIEHELLAQATGLAILANVYSVKIKTFGNTLFLPGSLLYINPSGLDGSLGNPTDPGSPSRMLGIGGYHRVYNVQSYIESGKYETTLDALWESAGSAGAAGSFIVSPQGAAAAGPAGCGGPPARSLVSTTAARSRDEDD